MREHDEEGKEEVAVHYRLAGREVWAWEPARVSADESANCLAALLSLFGPRERIRA